MNERRKILLGVVTLEDGEAVAFDLPLDGSIEDIRNAIERANRERAEAAKGETEYLRRLVGLAGDEKTSSR